MGTMTKAVPSAPTDGGTVDPSRPTVRPVAIYSRPMTDAEALDAVAADIVQRWTLSPLGPNATAKVKAEAEAAWQALCDGFTADMAVLAGDVATVPRPGTVATPLRLERVERTKAGKPQQTAEHRAVFRSVGDGRTVTAGGTTVAASGGKANATWLDGGQARLYVDATERGDGTYLVSIALKQEPHTGGGKVRVSPEILD